MSHFSVLVITDTKPSQAELEKIMGPWHEYECTGVDDEYVIDVDVTDQYREDFKKYGKPDQTWEAFVASWTEAEPDANGRYFRHTNPNAKWDWWQIGGRWTGMLSPVYDPEHDPSNTEICKICGGSGKRDDQLGRETRAKDATYTCNGCNGNKISTKWPTSWAKFAGDQIMRGHLQLEALQTQEERAAAETWDKFTAIVAGRDLPSFDELRDKHGIEKARELYWAIPVMADLNTQMNRWTGNYEDLKCTRDEYLRRARDGAVAPFAIVKDGKWYQKGEMGWWGMTRGEKEVDVWLSEVAKLVIDLPADKWLTVVDCHI